MKHKLFSSKKKSIISLLLLFVVASVAVTMAIAVANTEPVINAFEVAKIDTEIEENVDANLNKDVWITNSTEAKSHAFVRVRFNCTPEESINLIYAGESGQTWKYNEKDGFWYYLYSVKPGGKTTQLLDKIEPKEGYEGNMDVTVYHEACVASEEHVNENGAKALELNTVTDAFEKATKK